MWYVDKVHTLARRVAVTRRQHGLWMEKQGNVVTTSVWPRRSLFWQVTGGDGISQTAKQIRMSCRVVIRGLIGVEATTMPG